MKMNYDVIKVKEPFGEGARIRADLDHYVFEQYRLDSGLRARIFSDEKGWNAAVLMPSFRASERNYQLFRSLAHGLSIPDSKEDFVEYLANGLNKNGVIIHESKLPENDWFKNYAWSVAERCFPYLVGSIFPAMSAFALARGNSIPLSVVGGIVLGLAGGAISSRLAFLLSSLAMPYLARSPDYLFDKFVKTYNSAAKLGACKRATVLHKRLDQLVEGLSISFKNTDTMSGFSIMRKADSRDDAVEFLSDILGVGSKELDVSTTEGCVAVPSYMPSAAMTVSKERAKDLKPSIVLTTKKLLEELHRGKVTRSRLPELLAE